MGGDYLVVLQNSAEVSRVGRPKIGVRRPVKITLPEEDWEIVEQAIASGSAGSLSDYFRQLHEKSKRN